MSRPIPASLAPFVVATLLAVVLEACGSNSSAGPEGYLDKWKSPAGEGVEFIQITHNSANVKGTMDSVSYEWLGGSVGWSGAVVQQYSIAGSDDGTHLSLTFSPDQHTGGAPFSRSGHWRSGDLVLDVAQPNGALWSAVFVPANVNDYNAAVHALP